MGYFALLVGSFLLGSIPFGLFIGRLRGVDVRKVGSGNIGTSNVLRSAGWKAALAVLILDVLKAAVPVWVIAQFGYPQILAFWGGVAAVLGHNYSPFLGFKGGRGIASTLGVVLVGAPVAAAIGVGVWVIVVAATRYISVGSLLAAATVPLYFALSGRHAAWVLAGALLLALAVYRHIPNLQRLLAGTENRFGQRVK